MSDVVAAMYIADIPLTPERQRSLEGWEEHTLGPRDLYQNQADT